MMDISIFRKRSHLFVLSFSFLLVVLYSFTLANKRYVNFEYGKFDLGNMSQIVWNTAHGRFMEVTDQFGTNMPRWGMSHVDPILVLFAPIFVFYSHPMILVLAQHILIISAIFPLFWLARKKTKSQLTAYWVVGAYILYPAVGFTLVWTGFHGISFVAPLFIWIVWLLERFNFLVKKRSRTLFLTYWLLVVLMLMGKEEIGAILALASVPLYLKNKKLAIQTFIVSSLWFFIAFFIIIPAYSASRRQSIATFVESTGIHDVNVDNPAGENFFLSRYSYLGNSYEEMVKTMVSDPALVIKVISTKDKIDAINNLLGPLGYVVVIMPFWLISSPDLAIVLFSKDEIFNISNHRIAFVISALFISYVYFLGFLYRKSSKSINLALRYTPLISASIVMALTIYFSARTQNPLYVSGRSFIKDKFVAKVFAGESKPRLKKEKVYVVGDMRDAKVPRNSIECLNEMYQIVQDINPSIYSGPDYLGAHSSLRKVNALFPARYWDSDLVVADLFETKTIGPLESSGWTFNKEGLRRLLDTGEYKHLYSCGKVSAFLPGEQRDSSVFADDLDLLQAYKNEPNLNIYKLETEKIFLKVRLVQVPAFIERNKLSASSPFILAISKEKGEFLDKTTFWTFESVDNESVKISFIDYLSVGSRQGLDPSSLHQVVVETYYPQLPKALPNGKYHVFYGVGDLLRAKEIYLGKINLR